MRSSQWRRIIAATLLAILGFAGTTALGFWQYARAHRDDIVAKVLSAQAVPVQQLVRPAQYVPESAFAHGVTVRGQARLDLALATCGRVQLGRSGCWLLAPVTLTTDAPATTVVLGFVADAERDAQLAALRAQGPQQVALAGRLQPGELIDRGHALLPPSDTVTAINVNELAQRWSLDLLDGYVLATPPVIGSAVTAALITPPSGVTWRNLIYAWQWWAFAAFTAFLLYRYIADVLAEAPTMAPAASPSPEEQT